MRKVLTVSLLGLLLFVLASCGNSASRSFVRIVNASPDAGAIDISIGGTTLSNVAYATGSNYFTMAPGSSVALKVNQHGQTATLINTQITLTDKTYYTIAVVGLVGSSTVSSTLTIAQSVDDHSTAAAGDVKIRVLQADPYFDVLNSGKVDVYVGVPSATLNGTVPNFSGVSFPSMASFVSFTVPTTDGLLRIRVAPAGDANPDADSFLDTGTAGTLFKALQSRTFVILDAPPAGTNQFQGVFLNDLN